MDFGDVQIFCIEGMCENKCFSVFQRSKKNFWQLKNSPLEMEPQSNCTSTQTLW